MNNGLKVAVSWSGGKDSLFALYHAMLDGFQPCFLLNMINRDVKRSMSHGLDPGLLAAQAEAIEIPIVQREVTWDTYEEEFKRAVAELKQKGIGGMVFGDIDIAEHKEWTERVSREVGVTPILPLWGAEPLALLADFIDAGFSAIVVAAKAELFGPEWLGQRMDAELVMELQRFGDELSIHPCGEHGEYHTFVTDGPLFKKRVDIRDSETVMRDGLWFLDITSYELVEK